jgi:MFS family permease
MCEAISLLLIISQDFKLGISYYEEEQATLDSENGVWQSFVEGLSYLKNQPYLMPYIVINMFVAFAWTSVSVALPILVLNELHQGSQVYGTVEAFLSLGMVVGGLIFAKMKESPVPLQTALRYIVFCGIGIIGLGFATNLPAASVILVGVISVILFLMGISNELGDTPFFVFVQRHVPNHIQGRVNSLLNVSYQVLSPIGLLFFGWLLEQKVSASQVFVSAGLVLLIVLGTILKIAKVDFREARVLTVDELNSKKD